MELRRTFGLAVAIGLGGALLAGPAVAADGPTIDCSGTNLCIDLAGSLREQSWPIAPGTYTLKVQNMMPRAEYRLTVDSQPYQLLPSPITLPGTTKPTDPLQPMTAGEAQKAKCDADYQALATQYNDATDERAIRELNRALPSALKECQDKEAATLRQRLLDYTTEVKPPLKVEEHTRVTVTVEKLAGSGRNADVTTTWGPFTFATPRPPGQWLVYYGANYIYEKNEEYFAKANPNTMPQTYTITEKSDVGGGTFAAGLYFMWFDGNDQFRNWRCVLSCNTKDRFRGVTVGLGFDFDDPTLFAGYALGWGYNVMFTTGVAMSKVTRLAGQYREGDVVSGTLTESQLSDETYEPHFYVGAAIRFGDNPFQKSSKPPAAPSAPAPTEPTTEDAP